MSWNTCSPRVPIMWRSATGTAKSVVCCVLAGTAQKAPTDCTARATPINGDPLMKGLLLGTKQFLPGYYYMNEEHWITVLVNGSVPAGKIYSL